MRQAPGRGWSAVTWTLGVNIANLALGVATGVMTARGLAPHDRGALLALTLWTTTIASFALIGQDEAIIYQAGGAPAKAYALRHRLRLGARRQAGAGTLILAVITFLIVTTNGSNTWLAAATVLLIVPLNNYNRMSLAPLRASERFILWNIIRLTPATIYASLVLALTLLNRLSVTTGVVSLVAANIVTATVCALSAQSATLSTATVTEGDVESARRYGRKVFSAMIPAYANQRLDQLLLGLIVAPQFLGIYAVAVSIAAVIQTMGNTVDQVVFPRLVSGSTARTQIGTITAAAAATALTAAVILSFIGGDLIRFVYGADYVAAAAPLTILGVGAAFLVATSVLSSAAKADGDVRALFLAQTSGAILTLIALPSLALPFGLVGAAIASTSSYGLTFATLVVMRRRSVVQKDLVEAT